MRKIIVLSIVAVVHLSLYGQGPSYQVPHFIDITQRAGLNISHISSPDKLYIVESMSGGVGFIDCDNDGKLDIVTVNGSTMDRFKAGGDAMITLYHQESGLQFKDITTEAGLNRKGWGMGVAVADYDNDGLQDIYVTGFGGSVLYRNKGNCKFEDVTAKAGVNVDGFPTGASWGDYDRDGLVDLFVARYTHVDLQHYQKSANCTFMGVHVFCGPWGLPGETDKLFHNQGNGTFVEVSKKAGVSDEKGLFGMQGIWADFDNDGWPDLYVTNDRGPNYFYRNRHDGTFEDISVLSGAEVSEDGHEQGSMGVDAGDIDHDGKFDIFITNFTQESDTLYWNRGAAGFNDISATSGIAQVSFPYVGWGTGFEDFTNSGWDDLFVANGHIYPQMDQVHSMFPYRQGVLLFHNDRDRTFTDITHDAGLDSLPLKSRRGVAFGDVDNDGRVDILMLNVGEPPTLLLNCTEDPGHAVIFKLLGTKSNKAAIGARVTVTTGDASQMKEVRGGGSYLSQNDLRLHFGLGNRTTSNSVEIQWPSGKKETLTNVAADYLYTIEEGGGIKGRQPFAPTACADSSSEGHHATTVDARVTQKADKSE